jgi:hypothetical protein
MRNEMGSVATATGYDTRMAARGGHGGAKNGRQRGWLMAAVLAFPAIASAQCPSQTLTPPGGDGNESFGWGVALSPAHAAIGDSANPGPKKLYFYDRAKDGSLVEVSSVNFSVSQGNTLVFDGESLLAGVPNVSPGRVDVFKKSGSAWSVAATITPPTPATPQAFGRGLALDGDWLAIGATSAPGQGGQPLAGAVHLYARTGSTWTYSQTLANPYDANFQGVGGQIAIDGDWLVVGVGASSEYCAGCGAAWVYRLVGGIWTFVQSIGDIPEFRSGTGNSVAFADGAIVLGSTSGVGGQVWEYDADADLWAFATTLGYSTTSFIFGTQVTGNDEYAIVASQPTAEVYVRAGDGWALRHTLDRPEPESSSGSNTGWTAMSLVADTLLAGFPKTSIVGPFGGAALVFPLVGPDADGDGIFDDCDNCELPNPGQDDCDGNGVGDVCEIAGGAPDCNANGIVDDCDPDCNANGLPDDCDLAAGTSDDCNADGVPDECQLAGNDCNGNGIPDECDLASGRSEDCDGFGVPDECEGGFAKPYAVDNGSPSYAMSAGNTPLVWLNAFVVEDGFTTISALSVNWGPTIAGNPSIALWKDPNQDGDPADAQLLVSATDLDIAFPGNWTFATTSIPPTFVGEPGTIFFAGAQVQNAAPWVWATVDTGQPLNGKSWFANTADLGNLAANSAPQPLGTSSPPGNYMLRAIADADDSNGNGIPDVCEVTGDLDGDGVVGATDLGILLGSWGACPRRGTCAADLDGDGAVGATDLGLLLGAWS